MAVRQYIGARYVPTYYKNSQDPTSSEWEANVRYDPMTIVSLPNLHSYQSKKIVPANIGSPAQNPEYWYDQGYAQAYYQALQDQIDDMNDGDVEGSLQNQINGANSSIQDLTTEINDINGRVNARKTYAIFVGNSYLHGTGGTNVSIFDGVKVLFDEAEQIYSSGAGFFTYSGHDDTFETMLTARIATMSAAEKEEVTHVIVISAFGDTRAFRDRASGQATAFITQVNSFVNVVKNNLPNAKVYIAFAEGIQDSSVVTNAGSTFYDEYAVHDLFKSYCAVYCDITYLGWSGWEISHRGSTNFSSDGYHPNDTGYSKLVHAIKSALLGSYVPSIKREAYTSDIGIPIQLIGTIDDTTIMFGAWSSADALSGANVVQDFTYKTVIPAAPMDDTQRYVRKLLVDDSTAPFTNGVTAVFNSLDKGKTLRMNCTITLTNGNNHVIFEPLIIKHYWR